MTLCARSLTVAVALTATFGAATVAQSRPPIRAVRRAVDSLAHAYIDTQRSPAVSIEILRGADTVVRAGYGLADLEQQVGASPSTLYQIGSIKKQFAAGERASAAQSHLGHSQHDRHWAEVAEPLARGHVHGHTRCTHRARFDVV